MRRLARFLRDNWPILAAAALGLAVTLPHWMPGYPASGDRTDTWGHIARALATVEAMRAEGFVQGLLNAHWLPAWYMGDPARVYYPPLTVTILAPLIYLTNDPFAGYKLFVSGVIALLGALTCWSAMKLWNSKTIGLVAALLACAGPYTLNIVFVQGNLPRALALLALPALAWGTERLLNGDRLGWPIALSSLAWAFAAVSHSQQAAIYAICFVMYVFLRLLTDMRVPLRRAPLALLPLLLGIGVSAPYWLPAYLGHEASGVPYLPGDTIIRIFAARWSNFLPAFWQPFGEVVIPIGMLILGTLAVLSRPDPARKAWHGVCVAAILLSLGLNGPLYPLLPLNQLFMPDRFLGVATIMLPMVAAGLFPLGDRNRLARAGIIVALVALDIAPVLNLVLPHPAPAKAFEIGETLAKQPDNGRLLHLVKPEPFASDIYAAQIIGGKDLVMGWNLPNTPLHFQVRRALRAAEEYPAYSQKLLSLWNVRYVVTTAAEDATATQDTLQQAGFELIAGTDGAEIWANTQPSAPLQAVEGRRMLIIGDNLTHWAAAFPWAAEGASPSLEDYDAAYLDRFAVIGLARFTGDTSASVSRLNEWVSRGGTLIVDLSGFGSAYRQGYNFMGVQVTPVSISGERAIAWDGIAGMPSSATWVDETGGPWNGASYQGLDTVVARVAGLDETTDGYPIIGYKAIGSGKAWFVGLNYLYLLDISKDYASRDRLAAALMEGTGANQSPVLTPIPTSNVQFDWDSGSLSYTADQATPAVLSMTYSPRWEATIDGSPVSLSSYDRLMLIDLPAGEHAISLRYNPSATPMQRIGWVVGGVSLALVIAISGAAGRRVFTREGEATPELAGATGGVARPQEWHTTCPNCRFKLATGGPPTSATYPFNVIRCPVCGYRLDEFGFDLGQAQSDADKQAAALAWIESEGWSPSDLQKQFSVGVDELFEGRSAEPLPAVPPFFPAEMDNPDGGPPAPKQG